VLGGPATFNVLYTTQKFHDDNPKTYRAFYRALSEAAKIINADKKAAAAAYIRTEKSRLPQALVDRDLAAFYRRDRSARIYRRRQDQSADRSQ